MPADDDSFYNYLRSGYERAPRGPQVFRIGDRVRKTGRVDRTATPVGTVFTISRIITWHPEMWAYGGPTDQNNGYESSAWEDELELLSAGAEVDEATLTMMHQGKPIRVKVGHADGNYITWGVVKITDEETFIEIRPDLW